ncbi:MarR family transcriptional regulator [Pseudoalteromonas rubra]|uniref:MarR family transcriptional regulator n=1 Tax=Pseudoalteromonas rubra TaxID=43658 RepID=A0A5S3V4Y9_9GAMM|nr:MULTISPECIES: MarR family transcriptional regulator [Pseudoalteromonas]QPB82020.1 MarR family transcriptional regulator [Pseudoalteromonas rubra]
MKEQPSELRLDNQLCFSLYAASRQVTRLYQPLLKARGLTYPQYIVLMILWQQDGLLVGEIGKRAQLNSNTLTPLLKRLAQQALVTRERSERDERQCHIYLTEKGKALEADCSCIPQQMLAQTKMPLADLQQLKALLDGFLTSQLDAD